ncbi:2-oxoacid ferredoxin oxidoreductase [Candidatus Roizmanbacteria bacterium]|nr:2-oxoacid ferredoxin oxidoreductase [Candidatus Roizmanbacteria bacterium]
MNPNDYNAYFPTWCPGCGNFGIWGSLKNAFIKLGWRPDSFAIVYGVGCSGNMNDFMKAYGLHSLHGRALPNAIGIRLANHNLPVLVTAGDGDLLGEGGNHFMHACRGNYDITVVLHNNQVYGLTTGQVSPTSLKGTKSKSTPAGLIEEPIHPTALAITQGATFVAQGFAGDQPHLTELILAGIQHKGFAVINTYQPCVTFNKLNTYQWFRERIYKLDESHNKTDKMGALTKAMEQEKIPLGVLYQVEKQTYEESLTQLQHGPLIGQTQKRPIDGLMQEFV